MIMRRSGSSWCAVALAAALILPWSGAPAFAAANGSLPDDPSGAPAGYQGVRPARPVVPEGLDDTLKPLDEAAPAAVARSDVSDVALAPLLETVTRLALWERLAGIGPADRSKARVEVELGAGAEPADRLVAARLAEAWGAGRFDEAIAELRAFEESGGACGLVISWNEGAAPAAGLATAAMAAGGTDVRIGTRADGRIACLDFDAATGYLFAVLCWGAGTGGQAYWTAHRSTDGGATWSETTAFGSSSGIVEVSATVVGGYVYVGYILGGAPSEFRLRRCLVPSGSLDGGYGYQVVLDAGAATFEEICVVSNAQSSDNRIYCFAIQSSDSLKMRLDDAADGTTFSDLSPPVADAETGLDATWNHGYADHFLYVCYVATDGRIRAQSRGATWTGHNLASASGVVHRYGVSISAYEDNVICAYESAMENGRGIEYRISYDAGVVWSTGYLATPDGATVSGYMCPDVDAHDGHGTAVVYQAEVGEPDPVYYQKRAGYQPGGWETRQQFNDHDVSTGSWLTLSDVPVLGTTCFSHGAVYFNGGIPYFDLPVLGTADVTPPAVATGVRLHPPAPSPFSDRAAARFTLPAAGHARLEVFNVQGRRVATLADGPMEAGTHSLTLDGRGLGSGVYFCRLTAGAARLTIRFVVVH